MTFFERLQMLEMESVLLHQSSVVECILSLQESRTQHRRQWVEFAYLG
jgi:hypothetical protein